MATEDGVVEGGGEGLKGPKTWKAAAITLATAATPRRGDRRSSVRGKVGEPDNVCTHILFYYTGI